ncbi:MAG: DUF1343 domain-containing protein [Ignavibacteriae bacterium]|nr:DUF1343 domain-containing protein [Ignavibacteriota bacterium]MCB9216969.1 DUF1343 domain-containing protein [Ignavibacteria bacterium]
MKIFFSAIVLTAILLPKPILAQVLPGIDVLIENDFAEVKGKRVGLVLNQTAVRRDVRHMTLDAFLATDKCKLTAVFAPEHGIDGGVLAGENVDAEVREGLPIYSLYGSTKKPTKEMLKNVDVVIYDIQDIGVRSYTYISTLLKVMEGCAEQDVPLIVLDRPNPIGGDVVDGNVLDMTFKSFVGPAPIPYVHGLTVGELATMTNEEGWLPGKAKCDLTVIRMKGWTRSMTWRETGLLWIPTSPHVPKPESAFAIAATGTIGEISIINIGVGYTTPFELIGAPWMDGRDFAGYMNELEVPGIYFRPTSYKPFYAMSSGQMCGGVQLLRVGEQCAPFTATIALLTTLRDKYPDQKLLTKVKSDRWGMFDKVCGTDQIRKKLLAGESFKDIVEWWQSDLKKYISKREEYLLYE